MRVTTVAIIGIFAACAAFPATAQKAVGPTWEECHAQALKHGLQDLEKGASDFIKQCQAGKIPGVAQASLSRRPARGSFEECEARAQTLGLTTGQAGHIEYVRECMGGRPSSPSSQRR